MKGVQVMATINLQCNYLSQINSNVYFSMIGRAYMREVLTQVWLKSIKKVNAQKESLKKTSGVHASSCKSTKKCAMKMKETNKQEKVTRA